MNNAFCPNFANKKVKLEFEELVSIFGEDGAYLLWDLTKGNGLELAPNGADSKLFKTYMDLFNGDRRKAIIAKARVYTQEFKDWFGDWINDKENASKVVDKNGEPLIVQHGTFDDKFSVFLPRYIRAGGGFWAEDAQNAENYGDKRMYLFMNLRNPYNAEKLFDGKYGKGVYEKILEYNHAKDRYDEHIRYLEDEMQGLNYALDFLPESESSDISKQLSDLHAQRMSLQRPKRPNLPQQAFDDFHEAFYEAERDSQYSGLDNDPFYYRSRKTRLLHKKYGIDGEMAHGYYVVTSSNQLKSATDNNGNFDPQDIDIRYNLNQRSTEDDVRKAIKEEIALYEKDSAGNEHTVRYFHTRGTKIYVTRNNIDGARKHLLRKGFTENDFNINPRTGELTFPQTAEDRYAKDLHPTSREARQHVTQIADYLKQITGLDYQLVKPSDLAKMGVNTSANSFVKNGVVYLVDGRFTEQTTIEEFLHPFVNSIMRTNPELFLSLLDEASLAFPLLKSEIYHTYSNRKGFSTQDRQQELVTQALSRSLQEEFKKGLGRNKLEQLVRKFWNAIKQLFSNEVRAKDLRPDTTLGQLARIINSEGVSLKEDSKSDTQTRYNITPAQEQKQIVEKLQKLVHLRISAERRRKVRDAMVEADFDMLEQQLIQLHDQLYKGNQAVPQNVIDEIFKQVINDDKNRVALLEIAKQEVMQVKQHLDAIEAGRVQGNPETLLRVLRNVLDYYGNAMSAGVGTNTESGVLYDIFNSNQFKSLPNYQVALQEFQDISEIINGIDGCKNKINSIIKQGVDEFLDKFIDQNMEAGDINLFKENAHRWLDQHMLTTDVAKVLGDPSSAQNPIVRIFFHYIRQQQQKVVDPTQEVMSRLRKQMDKLQSKRINITNYQRRFCETDSKGHTTGYFISEYNTGEYYRVVREESKKIAQKYIDSGLALYAIEDGKEVLRFIEWNDEKAYLAEVDKMKDKYGHRRYKAEYYIKRREILSKDTMATEDYLNSKINAIRSKVAEEVEFTSATGKKFKKKIYRLEKLSARDYQALQDLEQRKAEFAMTYKRIVDANGNTVDYVPKTGDELRMAQEMTKWNAVKSRNVDYRNNDDLGLQYLKMCEQLYGAQSNEYRIACQRYINLNQPTLDYYDELDALLDKHALPDDVQEKLYELSSIVKDIKKRASIKGRVYILMSKLSENDFAVMKRVEQEISDILVQNNITSLYHTQDPVALNSMRNINQTPYVKPDGTTMSVPYRRPDGSTFTRTMTALDYLTQGMTLSEIEAKYQYVNAKGRVTYLSVFQYSIPSDPNLIGDKIENFFAPEGNWVNDEYDEEWSAPVQPKEQFRNQDYDKLDAEEKKMLEMLKQAMKEANQKYGIDGQVNELLMPQIHAEASETIFGNGQWSNPKSLNTGVAYAMRKKFGIGDETDDFNQKHEDPDRQKRGGVPVRYNQKMDDPEHISTDLLYTVTKYYEAASEYDVLSDASNLAELLNYCAQDDRLTNIMDTELYGIKTVVDKQWQVDHAKAIRRLAKIQQWTATRTTIHLLAWNLNSITKGALDALGSTLAFCTSGQYFTYGDYMHSIGSMLSLIFGAARTVGSTQDHSLDMALMTRFRIDGPVSKKVKLSQKTRARRVVDGWQMILQRFVDYTNTCAVMNSRLYQYRLVQVPILEQVIDQSNPQKGVHNSIYRTVGYEYKFINKQQTIELFRKAGFSRRLAVKKYKSATTRLKDAYELKESDAQIKQSEAIEGTGITFKDLITPEFEGTIRSGVMDLAALVNGVKPEGVRTSWISRIPLIGAFFTTRGFMLGQFNEKRRRGEDFIGHDNTGRRLDEKSITEEQRKYEEEYVDMLYNFSTQCADIGQWVKPWKVALDLLHNAIAIIANKFGGKMEKKNVADAKKAKLEQTAVEIALIAAPLMVLHAAGPSLLSFALQGGDDDDWKQKLLRWASVRLLLLCSANATERATFYSPETFGDLLDTPSTQYTWYKVLANFSNLAGFCTDFIRMVDVLSNNTRDVVDLTTALLSADGADKSEIVTRGAYKGMRKSTRGAFRFINALTDIPLDNIYKSTTKQGSLATFEYYNKNTIPNKYEWLGGWQPGSYSNAENAKKSKAEVDRAKEEKKQLAKEKKSRSSSRNGDVI